MLTLEEQREKQEKMRKRAALLPDAMVDFLQHAESEKSITTTYEYAKDLHLFCSFFLSAAKPNRPLSNTENTKDLFLPAVQTKDLEAFLVFLTKYERAFPTAAGTWKIQTFHNDLEGKNRKLSTLKACFTWLYKTGRLSNNPSLPIQLGEVPSTTVRNRLTQEEVAFLLQHIERKDFTASAHEAAFRRKVWKRDHALFTILLYTGLKVNECVRLNLDDILRSQCCIVVQRRNTGQEVIALSADAYASVERYWQERIAQHASNQDPFFISLQGNRLNPRTIRQSLEKYQKETGIPVRLTPQLLRRTFATFHYQANQNVARLTKDLGNRSEVGTERYYLPVSFERKNE